MRILQMCLDGVSSRIGLVSVLTPAMPLQQGMISGALNWSARLLTRSRTASVSHQSVLSILMIPRETLGAGLTGMNTSVWEPLVKQEFVPSLCIRDFSISPVYVKHRLMIGAVMLGRKDRSPREDAPARPEPSERRTKKIPA